MGLLVRTRRRLEQTWRQGPIRLPTRGTTDNIRHPNIPHSYPDVSQKKSSASLLATILLIAVGIFWALHGEGRRHERVDFHRGLPGFRGPVKMLSHDVVPCVGPGDVIAAEDDRLKLEGRGFDERMFGLPSSLLLRKPWLDTEWCGSIMWDALLTSRQRHRSPGQAATRLSAWNRSGSLQTSDTVHTADLSTMTSTVKATLNHRHTPHL